MAGAAAAILYHEEKEELDEVWIPEDYGVSITRLVLPTSRILLCERKTIFLLVKPT